MSKTAKLSPQEAAAALAKLETIKNRNEDIIKWLSNNSAKTKKDIPRGGKQ